VGSASTSNHTAPTSTNRWVIILIIIYLLSLI
jgi:hypothetical protein